MYIRKLLREGLLNQGVLNESMDIYIKDYNYNESLDTLSSIMSYINYNVTTYLNDLIGEEKLDEYRTSDFFEYDGGSNPFDPTGTINFYIWGMPTELVRHVCKYIGNLLMGENGMVVGFTIEKSGSFDSDVVRLDIQHNPHGENTVPELNMSNSNAVYFFTEILRYSKNEFRDGLFTVDDVLTRIKFAEENMSLVDYHDAPKIHRAGESQIISHGYNDKDVIRRLELLKDICLFAKEKGYNEIGVS